MCRRLDGVNYNKFVKHKYETGTATLIQFIVLGMLNILTGLQSIISTCRHSSGDCFGNFVTSFIFYLLIVGWFGVISVIGYGVQQSRSPRLAKVLIAAEVLVAMVAFFNVKLSLRYDNGILSLFTSVADLVLAIWIITLAWGVMKAGSGRRAGRGGGARRRAS